MKKIIFVCFLLMVQVFIQSAVLADEILDSKGNITPCKIETVVDGFVEYRLNGNLYSFARQNNQPIFNDYIDVKTKLFKKDSITRYTGTLLIKDAYGARLRNDNTEMAIPWYRVKFVGVYKP